jgi:hypothetical protein
MITWGKLMTTPACQPLAFVEPYADLLTARAAWLPGDLAYETVTLAAALMVLRQPPRTGWAATTGRWCSSSRAIVPVSKHPKAPEDSAERCASRWSSASPSCHTRARSRFSGLKATKSGAYCAMQQRGPPRCLLSWTFPL